MATKSKTGLKETVANFQLRGKVTGVKKDSFYKNGKGNNGRAWNVVNFGVEYDTNKTVYVKLQGFERDNVYFYKRAAEKGGKGDTKMVPWNDRFKTQESGYRMIGCSIGLEKDDNDKNINQNLTEFDAVEYMRQHLQDGTDVFIKGTMEHRSYTNKNGEVSRTVDLVPSHISLCSYELDFTGDSFEPMAAFETDIVFNGIEKEIDENGKPTGRFILGTYCIGYNSIEPCYYIIDGAHANLANSFRKQMKMFNSIRAYGELRVENQVEEVKVEDDGWGDAHSVMQGRVNGPTIREYVIVKADPNTIGRDEYSEENVMAAIRKLKEEKEARENFGEKKSGIDVSKNDWDDGDEDSDDEPW